MNYKITMKVEQDALPVRGNALASGNDAEDKEAEDDILERLASDDVWAWALVTVEATCQECGAKGWSALGACSYENEQNFRNDGGYFGGMCSEAKDECRNECKCWKPEVTDTGSTVNSL